MKINYRILSLKGREHGKGKYYCQKIAFVIVFKDNALTIALIIANHHHSQNELSNVEFISTNFLDSWIQYITQI